MTNEWPDRIRDRAYQLWEKEGRPLGREHDHWVRAEGELWQEALRTTTTLAARLRTMRRGLDDGTEDGLREAAETGCEAMKFLIDETDFASELRARRERSPIVWSPEARAYLDDLDLFEDFLAVERQILVRSGLDPVLADQITAHLKGEIARLRSGDNAATAASLLDIAVFRACEARDKIRQRALLPPASVAESRRSVRGVWLAVAGGMVFIANVAAAVAIHDVLAEISKEGGSFIFGQGLGRQLQ